LGIGRKKSVEDYELVVSVPNAVATSAAERPGAPINANMTREEASEGFGVQRNADTGSVVANHTDSLPPYLPPPAKAVLSLNRGESQQQ